MKALPSKEYLQECFTYDPETGLLYWKERPLEHFKSTGIFKSWNTKYSGKLALNYLSGGYKIGNLDGKICKSHRVIWKLCHGTEPDLILHENGNTFDNRIEKLSSGTQLENSKDIALSIKNRSGISGVHWHKHGQKWQAFISINKSRKHLGMYEDFFEACCVRKKAELEYGYHENHGRRRKRTL